MTLIFFRNFIQGAWRFFNFVNISKIEGSLKNLLNPEKKCLMNFFFQKKKKNLMAYIG